MIVEVVDAVGQTGRSWSEDARVPKTVHEY